MGLNSSAVAPLLGGDVQAAHRLRRVASVFLVVWLAAQVGIAWAPFRLDGVRPVRNGASLSSDGVITFSGSHERAVADPPVPWNDATTITVDLEVRTGIGNQAGPARILTVARDHHSSNLVIGQDGDDLIVRVRHGDGDHTERADLRNPDLFAEPAWHHVRVVVDDNLRVTVNGRVVESRDLPVSALGTWEPGYGISLGDEVSSARAWSGQIRTAQLSVDGRTHDLLAPGFLDIPDRFIYVPPRLRDALSTPNLPAIGQGVLHLLAWVPAGMLVASRSPWPRPSLCLAAQAGGVAVLLQTGKVAIEGRHPSLVVTLMQISGALLGAWLVGTYTRHAVNNQRLESHRSVL